MVRGKFSGGQFSLAAIILERNYPGGNQPGGNYPRGNYQGGVQFSLGARKIVLEPHEGHLLLENAGHKQSKELKNFEKGTKALGKIFFK